MLDLSNNNSGGHNFKAAHVKGGQVRVYLKRCQGIHFVDTAYPRLRADVLKVKGMRVGAYDFLEPLTSTPTEAANFLLKLIAKPLVHGKDLRPCLDCEWHGSSHRVGEWIVETQKRIFKELGVRPLIYGSGHWLQECNFKTAPGPLWLAAYGRNDGREYPVGKLPRPWKRLTAHQYTSKAHVIGIHGECDLSHVFLAANVEVPKRRK